MTQVTNGVVKYGRTVKTGDYENKRADVELSFTVAEGENPEHAIFTVGNMAAAHCNAILNVPNETPVAKPAAAEAPKSVKKAAKVESKAEAPKAETVEVDEAEVPAILKGKMLDPTTGKPAMKNGEIVDNDPLGIDDGLGDLLGIAEPAKEVTDVALHDATQKCQDETRNPLAIRKLLDSLGIKAPLRVIDLAQEKRPAYLEGLKKIRPLA